MSLKVEVRQANERMMNSVEDALETYRDLIKVSLQMEMEQLYQACKGDGWDKAVDQCIKIVRQIGTN